jgi:hypothetical protein
MMLRWSVVDVVASLQQEDCCSLWAGVAINELAKLWWTSTSITPAKMSSDCVRRKPDVTQRNAQKV